MQLFSVGEALDGGDLVAAGLDRQHEAGANGYLVDQDRAGAAHAVLTAQVRAGELQSLPQEVGQCHPDVCLGAPVLAVYIELDGLAHGAFPAREAAASSDRRTVTRAS